VYVAEDCKVRGLKSAGEHAGIAQVLDRDTAVAFKA
jgi:hypothetical protein